MNFSVFKLFHFHFDFDSICDESVETEQAWLIFGIELFELFDSNENQV